MTREDPDGMERLILAFFILASTTGFASYPVIAYCFLHEDICRNVQPLALLLSNIFTPFSGSDCWLGSNRNDYEPRGQYGLPVCISN